MLSATPTRGRHSAQRPYGPGTQGVGEGPLGLGGLHLVLCSSGKPSSCQNVPEFPGLLCPWAFSMFAISESSLAAPYDVPRGGQSLIESPAALQIITNSLQKLQMPVTVPRPEGTAVTWTQALSLWEHTVMLPPHRCSGTSPWCS